jgi:hypothetical protein
MSSVLQLISSDEDFVRIRQLPPNRTGNGRHYPENPPEGMLQHGPRTSQNLQNRAAAGYGQIYLGTQENELHLGAGQATSFSS